MDDENWASLLRYRTDRHFQLSHEWKVEKATEEKYSEARRCLSRTKVGKHVEKRGNEVGGIFLVVLSMRVDMHSMHEAIAPRGYPWSWNMQLRYMYCTYGGSPSDMVVCLLFRREVSI